MAKVILAKKVLILFGEEIIHLNVFGDRTALEEEGYEFEEVEEEKLFRRMSEILEKFQNE